MDMVEGLLKDIKIPRMVKARQVFPRPVIEDVGMAVRQELNAKGVLSAIKPGQSVAVTAGSRGIVNLPLIIRETVRFIRAAGGNPFIFPAMGSHGGATAEGQEEMLRGMGICEETVEAPIKAGMEVIQVGISKNGLPAYIDQYAYGADAVVVINRIKPHVAFRGPHESGLMKMITIGMGKQKGADTCHNLGFGKMAESIPDIGKEIISKTNIIFALGILENAYDETRKIVVLCKNEIEKEEPLLLKEAWTYIPKIPFDEFECLIIDEIGKDICGTGFDTNTVGRYHTPYASGGPKINRVAVLDLTERSHGNANGIGIVDFTTRRFFNKMRFDQTYPNSLTSTVPASVKIPMVLENDRLAVQAMMKTSNIPDRNKARIVRIKNTLDLEYIYFSENLLPLAEKSSGIEILSEPEDMVFDNSGNLF